MEFLLAPPQCRSPLPKRKYFPKSRVRLHSAKEPSQTVHAFKRVSSPSVISGYVVNKYSPIIRSNTASPKNSNRSL